MPLAQLNIARMLEPLDSPPMKDFVDGLDRINSLAEATPGFVWRLIGEANDATSLRPFDDEMVIVNMSVWDSLEALRGYVYKTAHVEFLKRKQDWFEKAKDAMVVLWWVVEDHTPSVEEAKQKLEHLRLHGPSAEAFTFGTAAEFASPSEKPRQTNAQKTKEGT